MLLYINLHVKYYKSTRSDDSYIKTLNVKTFFVLEHKLSFYDRRNKNSKTTSERSYCWNSEGQREMVVSLIIYQASEPFGRKTGAGNFRKTWQRAEGRRHFRRAKANVSYLSGCTLFITLTKAIPSGRGRYQKAERKRVLFCYRIASRPNPFDLSPTAHRTVNFQFRRNSAQTQHSRKIFDTYFFRFCRCRRGENHPQSLGCMKKWGWNLDISTHTKNCTCSMLCLFEKSYITFVLIFHWT